MLRRPLMNDRADTMSLDNGPDEEDDAGSGDEVGLNGKEMSNLMDREPNGGQTAKPEKEEADEVHGIGARTRGHAVGDILVLGPYRSDHESDAFTADPRLHTVPDAGHGGAVEDGPKRAPNPKGGPADDGEGDVVGRADPSSHANKGCGDEVANPNTEP